MLLARKQLTNWDHHSSWFRGPQISCNFPPSFQVSMPSDVWQSTQSSIQETTSSSHTFMIVYDAWSSLTRVRINTNLLTVRCIFQHFPTVRLLFPESSPEVPCFDSQHIAAYLAYPDRSKRNCCTPSGTVLHNWCCLSARRRMLSTPCRKTSSSAKVHRFAWEAGSSASDTWVCPWTW